MEQVMDDNKGLELTAENVDTVLDEIRPYLVGTGGGGLELVELDGPIAKVGGVVPGQSVRSSTCCGSAGKARPSINLLLAHCRRCTGVAKPCSLARQRAVQLASADGRPARFLPAAPASTHARTHCLSLQVQITGPAANVMTVRVAVTQKLRERIPGIAAVQLVN